jgi:SAM-dependent methyltransferase
VSFFPDVNIVGKIHGKMIHRRRVAVLARMLAGQLKSSQSVLDIGCGDGTLSALIAERLPGIRIQGVEFLPRRDCAIPCVPFDGTTLPFPDDSFDVCMFVDVLHHTEDVRILLREAVRVTRSYILIKDHLDENFLDHLTLRVMDWVGNSPHGVKLTYNYQCRDAWRGIFAESGLRVVNWTDDVPIYPAPGSWIAGRHLHFVALLEKAPSG